MIHVDADPDQLDLTSDWLSWGTYGDDYFPRVFGSTHDLAGAKHCDERLALFMPLDPEAAMPEPQNPVERGLADLWRRTAGPMPPPAREAFRTTVREMTASWLWELANEAQHRIPDPIDYVEMRRRTFGSNMTIGLSRLARWDAVPPGIWRTRTLRELETAAQDYACFTNDLFSYQKEIEFEGELHNIVLVIEKFLDVDRLRARDIVADLMESRMRQFEHIADTELPALFEDLNLDEPTRATLTAHADRLKDWMSGILEWHRRCLRYTEAELLRTGRGVSLLPTGLGTSAVRMLTEHPD
jgi:germacradienol/geosmin synthase